MPGWIVFAVLVALIASLVALILSLRRRRESPPREPVVVRFPDAKLTVTVPAQSRPVLVAERPMPPLEELDSPNDEFDPTRLLVNFEIIDAENPQIPLTYFDPPLVIEAEYTQEQVEAAQRNADVFRKYTGGQVEVVMPLLGFWDGTHWILFTAGKNQVIYRPNEDPRTGGVLIAKVHRWADPPMGWWP
ncbi:MAG: hypothetical protein HY870_20120 [Chloroflexi bacterium]|nr:hypothetical protein [Chloroflexota bacterium]